MAEVSFRPSVSWLKMASTVARSEQWEYWTQRVAFAAEFDVICVTRCRKAVHAPYPRSGEVYAMMRLDTLSFSEGPEGGRHAKWNDDAGAVGALARADLARTFDTVWES